MGHVARVLEAGGISTIIIGIQAFRPQLEAMFLPRVLVTPHLMGRTLGPPGDRDHQKNTILAGLGLLASAENPGTMVELPGRYQLAQANPR